LGGLMCRLSCENAEIYVCRVCLRAYCLNVSSVEQVGKLWPVYCGLGHPPSQLVPSRSEGDALVRVLRVGLRTPGDMGGQTWSVLDPLGGIRADS